MKSPTSHDNNLEERRTRQIPRAFVVVSCIGALILSIALCYTTTATNNNIPEQTIPIISQAETETSHNYPFMEQERILEVKADTANTTDKNIETISPAPSMTPSVSNEPTVSSQPSMSSAPSLMPSVSTAPSSMPSVSASPSMVPSLSAFPSMGPSSTEFPTDSASEYPTDSSSPSERPSENPTISLEPSLAPTEDITEAPSSEPSAVATTDSPSTSPSQAPTKYPSTIPTVSNSPSALPSASLEPSSAPSGLSEAPSVQPSAAPTTTAPSSMPSASPTETPAGTPSQAPTSFEPTTGPTAEPSISTTSLELTTSTPSREPSLQPTTFEPTAQPSASTVQSTPTPSDSGTVQMSQPSPLPTLFKSDNDTAENVSMPCKGTYEMEEENYYVYFEEFDTSVVNDTFLENALNISYGKNAYTIPCEPRIINITRIPDEDTETRRQLQYSEALIYTERIEFKFFSWQVNATGLFPTPIIRGMFLGSLNDFFLDANLVQIYAIGVKEVPPPTEAPTLSPTEFGATLSPTEGPFPVPTTVASTGTPTLAPSSERTVAPSSEPTPDPTPPPTKRPTTPNPSPFPSTGAPNPTPTTTDPSTSPPTSAPSPVPSNVPTPKPTFQPSKSPTFRPTTQSPTLRPTTQSPTLRPTTQSPTLRPTTQNPTLRPTTQNPTSRPTTQNPTLRPTAARPSRSPTARPTSDESSLSATARPTREELSLSATARPTSEEPSLPPTTKPTLAPTIEPTPPPTTKPTFSPTTEPTRLFAAPPDTTEAPVGMSRDDHVDLTDEPTQSPSSEPTEGPTSYPTSPPTTTPSREPTPSPTITSSVLSLPSFSPSSSAAPSKPNYMLREPELRGVSMLLVGVSRLNIESQLVWVDTMETAVESEVVNILNDVESVDVRIEIESQNLQSSQTLSLQEDSPSPGNLTILFDVDFFIRAAVEDHNVKRYIGGTLDSEADKETFIAKLKAEDPINFASLIYVTLTLPQDTTESGILVEPANYDSEALGAGITVGIAAIGLAGVSLFVIAVYWWNRRRTDNSQSTPSTENNRIRNLFEYEQNTLTVEVSEKPELDVSTLGDPIPYNAPAPMDVSLAEETLSLPYDYKIATAQAMPSLDESASYSGFSDMSSNIIDVETDDGTLDAQYNVEDRIEVEVPPGMLGLVLEADSEGVATVYDMKELSPLEQIRIGDRLVSVDHVDVTAMSVGSVMKLIASKRNKPIRKLVFTRSPRRSSSSKLASWNRDGGDGDEED